MKKKLLMMAALISEAIGSILPGVECSTANSAPSWRRLPSPLAVTLLCHVWRLEALGGSHMLGRNQKKPPPFQSSPSHQEGGKPARRHFSWRQGGQGGLRGTCHPKSRNKLCREGNRDCLHFEEHSENHNLLFKGFWHARVPPPSVCRQTRVRARICSEPPGGEDSGGCWTLVRVFPADGAVGTADYGAGGKSGFFLGLGAQAGPFLSSL